MGREERHERMKERREEVKGAFGKADRRNKRENIHER